MSCPRLGEWLTGADTDALVMPQRHVARNGDTARLETCATLGVRLFVVATFVVSTFVVST